MSDRISLRKRLDCKSYKWFLDNIFPEAYTDFVEVSHDRSPTEVRNTATNRCLDTMSSSPKQNDHVQAYQCHGKVLSSRPLSFTFLAFLHLHLCPLAAGRHTKFHLGARGACNSDAQTRRLAGGAFIYLSRSQIAIATGGLCLDQLLEQGLMMWKCHGSVFWLLNKFPLKRDKLLVSIVAKKGLKIGSSSSRGVTQSARRALAPSCMVASV